MTLQGSGPISLSDIRTEFDQSGPIALSDYYRGGSKVPSGAGGAVPTSGPLALSDFYGSSNRISPTVPIGGDVFTDTDTRVYTSTIQVFDETWNVPDLWLPGTYQYYCTASSTAAYDNFGFGFQLYVDGVSVFAPSQPSGPDGYFRYNSGTLTYTKNITVEQNQVVRATAYGTWRTTGPTPSSTLYHRLRRTA